METEKTVQGEPPSQPESGIQGEGDYEATRRHRDAVETFVKTHDVEQLASDAEPNSSAERRELESAEQVGLSKSRAPNGTDSKASDNAA
jgi:hypothetical protein